MADEKLSQRASDIDASIAESITTNDSASATSISIHKVREFWIEKSFSKRECSKFIPAPSSASQERCTCGRYEQYHTEEALKEEILTGEEWQISRHTLQMPTDAFGHIDFQGGTCTANKAQFVRLDYLSPPEKILQLLLHHWQLELPKLLISVHGGIANFELQPKLKRVFNKGLIKAANTTGAWIITGGTNTGYVRHVGSALAEKSVKTRKKHIVAIGVSPWGVIHNRHDLLGKDVSVNYHAAAQPSTSTAVLNSSHNYFLLADNGTECKYGADFLLRKKLERYISLQRIHTRGENLMKGHGVPIVCVVLEGGNNTIRTVLDYLTESPPVPVVVCDGSGRAADIISFVHKYTDDKGVLPPRLNDQLISTIKKTFNYDEDNSVRLFDELMLCMKKKSLITVFRMGEHNQDIDLPILTALLSSHNTGPAQQLSLAMSWDRVDVARSHIFTYGQQWPDGALSHAMMQALVQNKVEFVELLLDKGVDMSKFLTIPKLEELYNTKVGATSTLHMMIRDIRKNKQPYARVSLLEVGEVIEKLMGGAYRSSYCRRKFKLLYYSAVNLGKVTNTRASVEADDPPFPYPFSDLLLWAVLLKRQTMAKFMWKREEEALPKAIMACSLYKALAREAVDEPLLDNTVSEDLENYAIEFQKMAVDILDHCYKEDDEKTNKLLTYELKSYSSQTCISLAHKANMRDFIGHPCCQNLITDMWLGGLRMNKSSTLKIILGIILPPAIISLDFKSKGELQSLPQTVEEHQQELEESDSSSSDEDDESQMDTLESASVIEIEEVSNMVTWQPASAEVCETPNIVNKQPDGNLFTTAMFKELKKRHEELGLGKKIHEFYTAPVTKFWLHTMAYIFFLCLYNYIVVTKLERVFPSWMELYVIAYIFFHAMEMIREIAISEPVKIFQKIKVFFEDKWNLMDSISVTTFWIAVGCRFSTDEYTFLVGRVFYSCNIVFWYVRILELFAVSKNLGPYVVIVGKLVMDMLNFIVILLIVLMAFGTLRVAIRNPYNEPDWMTARNIFLEPYYMLYGEVYAEIIDPECGPGKTEPVCYPGRWIVPAAMSAYLLVANILLLNLLIAVFNDTFRKTREHSKSIWMTQRYGITLEYEIKPLLPSPFVLFSFIYLFVKFIVRRCKRKPHIQDYGLKLFLTDEEVRKLHDFEEDCVDNYFNNLELKFESSTEERIRATNERVENILLKIEDINQKENQMRMSVQMMEHRLSHLEDIDKHMNAGPVSVAHSLDHLKEIESGTVPCSPEMMRSRRTSMLPEMLTGKLPMPSTRLKASMKVSKNKKVPVDKTDSKIGSLSDGYSSCTKTSLQKRRKHKELKPVKSHGSAHSLTSGYTYVESNKNKMPDFLKLDIPHIQSASAALQSFQNSWPPIEEEKPLHISQANHPEATSAPDLKLLTKRWSVSPSITVATDLNIMENNLSTDSIISPRTASIHSDINFDTLFTPVKSLPKSEYTSIMDSVDTSCIIDSPSTTPTKRNTSPTNIFFVPHTELSSPDQESPQTIRSETQFIHYETHNLKKAEEHEHKVIGKSLRRRIRQISIEENHELNDIAQKIVNNLDPSLSNHAESMENLDDLSFSHPSSMPRSDTVVTSLNEFEELHSKDI